MNTIFTKDLGVLPGSGKDCSEALQKAFDSIEDNATVVLAPGDYVLGCSINLNGKKNLKILGYGAKMIAKYDPRDPYAFDGVFKFHDCSDIQLSGMVVTMDNKPNLHGTVFAIDYENLILDIKLEPGYHYTGNEKIRCFDSCDEDYAPNGHIFFADDAGYRCVKLSENMLRIYAWPSAAEQIATLRLNERICMKLSLYPCCPIIFKACSEVLVSDVTIESSPGVALAVYPRSKNFTFRRFAIRLPIGDDRIYASNADGIHVTGLIGKLIIEDCYFEHMGDDALNIHNEGATVFSVDGNTLGVYGHRFNSKPEEDRSKLSAEWGEAGDVVYVYDGKTFAFKGEFTIGEFGDKRIVISDKKGDFEICEGDYLANSVFLAQTEIRRTTVRNSRARGFLLQTHNAVVEDCRFYGTSGAAVIVSPDMETWNEMPPMQNLTIRRNVIERCGTGHGSVCGGVFIGNRHYMGVIENPYPAGMHKNIAITDNTFINAAGSVVIAYSVDGLDISRNTVSCREAHNQSEGFFELRSCNDVALEDNALLYEGGRKLWFGKDTTLRG